MILSDGKITILFSSDGAEITLYDGSTLQHFLKVFLTPEQVVTAFSRQSHTDCVIEASNLERVGKLMESIPFVFEITKIRREYLLQREHISEEDFREKVAKKCLEEINTQGYSSDWIPDLGFRSRDSLFDIGGKDFAKTTLRRWK